MSDPVADAAARLDIAFVGRFCVSAWLGSGEVLFMGFGEQPLPERGADGRRSVPAVELQTNFADWSVTGPDRAVSTELERGALEAAARSLLGRRVVGWEWLPCRGLRVAFEGGAALTIVPWPTSGTVSDAWSLACPDGKVVAVSTAGHVVLVSARVLIADWFGPAAWV